MMQPNSDLWATLLLLVAGLLIAWGATAGVGLGALIAWAAIVLLGILAIWVLINRLYNWLMYGSFSRRSISITNDGDGGEGE